MAKEDTRLVKCANIKVGDRFMGAHSMTTFMNIDFYNKKNLSSKKKTTCYPISCMLFNAQQNAVRCFASSLPLMKMAQ